MVKQETTGTGSEWSPATEEPAGNRQRTNTGSAPPIAGCAGTEHANDFTIHQLPDGRRWIEAHRLATKETRRDGFQADGGIHRDSRTNRTERTQQYYDGEPVCTADGELLTFNTIGAAVASCNNAPDTRPTDQPRYTI